MLTIIKKVQKFFDRKQKTKLIIIGCAMVIGAFFEMIGISLILPFITLILNRDSLESNKFYLYICNILKIESFDKMILILIVLLIFVFIIKNLFLFGEYYIQYKFICNTRYNMQRKILRIYLNKPYKFFLDVNTGEILRVITEDIRMAFDLILYLLNYFTELIITIGLVLTIIVINPMIAGLIAIVSFGLITIISFFIKPLLRKLGLKYQESLQQSNKWLLQAISGIKEIKVNCKEKYFEEQFKIYGKENANIQKTYSLMNNVPRLLIETISICSMLGIMAALQLLGKDFLTMIPQISAFAMAAVRILPSINRMSTAINTVSYQEPMLDKLLSILREGEMEHNLCKESEKKEGINLKNLCKLDKISYQYPNAEAFILDNVNMEIPIGKSIGIIGSSGSGKTTTIDILLGLLEPISGSILCDGKDVKENFEGWKSKLGYIPQSIYLLDASIKENIAFGCKDTDVKEENIWRALEEAQLADYIKTLPKGIDTTVGERGIRLSGGQIQRIGIARALYRKPEILIFDEATSSLDMETEKAVMSSIDKLHGKITLIIIAHRLKTIENCDIVYQVENKKIRKMKG